MTTTPVSTTEPFALDVPDDVLADLRDRLDRTRWPEGPDDAGWDTGVPAGYLRELCAYWRDAYDWRAQEAGLNALAQLVTTVDGARVHLVHVRSPEWTECDRPDDVFPRDRLLTNVMLYWLTGTAGSSARLYWETAHSADATWRAPSTVPTGVAVFGDDVAKPVRRLAERDNAIVHWSELDRGGHFAAMEVPDLFVEDVRTFFRRVRPA